jgi:SAM-dependent methyltransferase
LRRDVPELRESALSRPAVADERTTSGTDPQVAIIDHAISRGCAGRDSLSLEYVDCSICKVDDVEPIGVGEDFEYRTSADSFLAVRCRQCGLVYLNPRPANRELARIYPTTYHAYDFSAERYGLAYRVRRRLEARRLLGYCRDVAENARIIDVGCGDGFHLKILREFGKPGWRLEGVDPHECATVPGAADGVIIHRGAVQTLDLPKEQYDLALLIATIEHVDDPVAVLRAVRDLLCPGGRAVVVTNNTMSLDFMLFRARHWGGYHFPRHWNLFDAATLKALADQAGLEIDRIGTLISPVNWIYSLRNLFVDWGAPGWVVDRFSLQAPAALALLTAFDALHYAAGRGALLRAVFRRPQATEEWPLAGSIGATVRGGGDGRD